MHVCVLACVWCKRTSNKDLYLLACCCSAECTAIWVAHVFGLILNIQYSMEYTRTFSGSVSAMMEVILASVSSAQLSSNISLIQFVRCRRRCLRMRTIVRVSVCQCVRAAVAIRLPFCQPMGVSVFKYFSIINGEFIPSNYRRWRRKVRHIQSLN